MSQPTTYWHRLEDGRVQCDVCPRACRLHEGQRGFCFVRACEGAEIVLTTYGRSSGFCADPIEKKPLNHFLPGTPVLSFGTAGCTLGCKLCQNWDISKSREVDTLADTASPEALAETALRLGCRSVAFTYNDPVIFLEYAIGVAEACRARGVQAVAVTAPATSAPARERSSSRTWTRPTSTSRRSRSPSTRRLGRATFGPCWTRSGSSCTRRTSADATGDHDRVVGYGAFAISSRRPSG